MNGYSVSGRLFLYSIVMISLLSACGTSQSETNGNPAPKDFLEQENADIFMLGSIVYSNVEDVEWVQELDYNIGEQIAEISEQTDNAGDFTNGSATKLPVGTKIFKTDKAVYIAVVDSKEIPYLKMIEG
ncbi:hypothetical protein VBD025_04325 [Virgibacillus flavescens]|uniref:hypothetical protein n=1 Tax=Virgibacillus flavescens TaxID=1611422 RepID=UPI003D353A0C